MKDIFKEIKELSKKEHNLNSICKNGLCSSEEQIIDKYNALKIGTKKLLDVSTKIWDRFLSSNNNFLISNPYIIYKSREIGYNQTCANDAEEVINEICKNIVKYAKTFSEGNTDEKVIIEFAYCYNSLLFIYNICDVWMDNDIKSLMQSNADAEQQYLENRAAIDASKVELRAKLNDIIQRKLANYRCLENIEFGNGFKDSMVLGVTHEEELEDDFLDYANNSLGVDLSPITSKFLKFDLNVSNSVIFVDCDKKLMEDSGNYLNEFIQHIICSFIVALPQRKAKIAAIECGKNAQSPLKPVIVQFANFDKLEGNNYEFLYSSMSEEPKSAEELLSSITDLSSSRNDTYVGSGRKFTNIYEYNQKIQDNQQEFVLLVVNNYPKGFDTKLSQNLEAIMKNSKPGIITVVFRSIDLDDYKDENNEDYYDNKPYKINEKDYPSITISNINCLEKTFDYNGITYSYNIDKGFDRIEDYVEQLSKKIQTATPLMLSDVLQSVQQDEGARETYSIINPELNIPIGKEDDKIFNFTTSTKECPNAIILGGTGAGKTALLHTIILSGCAMYSPDELQFYLADFKSEDISPSFGMFEKGKSTYIPHVSYLSMKASPENSKEFLDMINTEHSRRMQIIANAGFDNICDYNKSISEENKKKRLCKIVAIIDECASMFPANNDERSITKSELQKKLTSLLSRVRSSGISIVLCGQIAGNMISSVDTGNIKNRYALRNFQAFDNFFCADAKNAYSVQRKISSFFTSKGRTVATSDAGIHLSFMSAAFSGAVGSDVMNDTVDKINKTYPVEMEQRIAGSLDYVETIDLVNVCGVTESFNRRDKVNIPVYIGQSSASLEPVALMLSSDSSEKCKCIINSKNSRSTIERNILLGFLNSTAQQGYPYNSTRAFYAGIGVSDGDMGESCFEQEVQLFPFLKNHLQYVSEYNDLSKTVSFLNDLLSQRIKNRDKKSSPYLFIIHNPHGLKEDTFTPDDPSNTQSDSRTIQVDSQKIDIEAQRRFEEIQKKPDFFKKRTPEEWLEMCKATALRDYNLQVEKQELKVLDESKIMDKQTLLDTISSLVKKGPAWNIFVILSFPNKDKIIEYFEINRDNEKLKELLKCSITEHVKDGWYSPSSCYISTFNYMYNHSAKNVGEVDIKAKVRLYKYDDTYDRNSNWWQKLEKSLKREDRL